MNWHVELREFLISFPSRMLGMNNNTYLSFYSGLRTLQYCGLLWFLPPQRQALDLYGVLWGRLSTGYLSYNRYIFIIYLIYIFNSWSCNWSTWILFRPENFQQSGRRCSRSASWPCTFIAIPTSCLTYIKILLLKLQFFLFIFDEKLLSIYLAPCWRNRMPTWNVDPDPGINKKIVINSHKNQPKL